MPPFDLNTTLEKATRRLRSTPRTGTRQRRSDRGALRIDPRIVAAVADAVGGYDRPKTADVLKRVADRCRTEGLRAPSRATVYKLLATMPTPTFVVASLPPPARSALYNLEPDSKVPAHQVAFYCFNYGDLRAVMFAAGLPWLALYQARRLPGFRAKSRGLIEAVVTARGI